MSYKSTMYFPVLFVFLVVVNHFSTVRSSSAIRLPSEDLCARSGRPTSCPVTCFAMDPVCGEDGVTYWCGCADAICAGTKVTKLGFCEIGNNGHGGADSLSAQILLLVHIVWLIVLGFSVMFGLF